MVTQDTLHIAEQVKDLDPNLRIVQTEPKRGKVWMVVEEIQNPATRTREFTPVKRYEKLDGRVVEDLRRMLKIPLAERLKELDEWAAAEEKAEWDAKVEKIGELGEKAEWAARKDGLIHLPVSTRPKKSKTKGVGL